MFAAPEKSTLTYLTRLAQRNAGTEHLLRESLRGLLGQLAEAVLEVAFETGDPVDTVKRSRRPGKASASCAEL